VFGYLIGQALLRLPPLLRLAFKKGWFNKTIEPIFVKLIETILNLRHQLLGEREEGNLTMLYLTNL
jgi:hypothetical protein